MAETGETLSERELAVLACLVDGSTNREIARSLHISPNTVKVHLRNIFTKLDVSSRTEATAVALQKGLLSLPGLETTVESEAGENQQPESIIQAAAGNQPPLDALGGRTNPTPPLSQTSPAPRWRTLSLALAGLLILVLLILVGLQILEGPGLTAGNGAASGTEPRFEIPIGDSRWFTIPALPRPISNLALASVGLNVYQIGGEVEAGVTNLVNIYETDSGRWLSGASKPTAVADTSAAVLFGEIYVPGGRLADGQPTAVVEAYSPANNAWRPIPPLPKAVSGGLALSDGSRLYLFGGWDGQTYLDTSFVYDSGTDMWQTLPSMAVGRAFLTGGFLSGEFIVVGGQNEEGELALCQSFIPGEGIWQNCPEMNNPRAGAGGAVIGNNWLYIIGGGLNGQVLDSEVFNIDNGIWQSVAMPMLQGNGWFHLAVSTIETRIFVFGGRQGNTIRDDGFVFSPLFQTFLPAVGVDE